ncbi:MAG: ANTAR domain-containing response regulator [Pirellulaceae bacterium]
MSETFKAGRGQPRNGRSLMMELGNLDLIVATRRDEDGELLIRELQRVRAKVRHLWPVPDRLPEDADVIFSDFVPGLADRIPWIPGEPKAALVTLIPLAPPPDLAALRDCAPDAVLHKPFTTYGILTSLVMARSHFLYEQRLRSRIEKLDENLRAMRSVERAKAILMNSRSLREDEAYNFLRRQAMARRVSISAVAAAIVDSHEILG